MRMRGRRAETSDEALEPRTPRHRKRGVHARVYWWGKMCLPLLGLQNAMLIKHFWQATADGVAG